ncbi:Hypothetical predicted protein, partial [Olea europaea subsp. europaea]
RFRYRILSLGERCLIPYPPYSQGPILFILSLTSVRVTGFTLSAAFEVSAAMARHVLALPSNLESNLFLYAGWWNYRFNRKARNRQE